MGVAGAGMAPSQPLQSRPQDRGHYNKLQSELEAGATEASEELAFYSEFKRPCVLLKTIGAN